MILCPQLTADQVSAKLSNSVLVLDVLNTIEILEYGLTAIEDLTSTLSFWTSYVHLPPAPPSPLPTALFGGANLRVSAEATQFGIILLEHHSCSRVKDTSTLANAFRISFDGSVVITSNQSSESLTGSLQGLNFGTYRQVRSLRILLSSSSQ
jgi:hypothetical protein